MRSIARGFTLIEMMVVVLIIGLSAGMVTLAISPDRAGELEKAADKLLLQSEFVAEQSTLTGEVIGLFARPNSTAEGEQWCYRWRRFRDSSWTPVSEALPDQCLPADTGVEMIVEGEPYEFDPNTTSVEPVLIFYPSGEATRFEVALFPLFDNDEEVQRLDVDMMGRVRWLNRDPELADWENER
ncbi:prepilin-type N-terminal cleavage/methylation domain-containing protein [Gilvimarinus agarilyticus]|uniref:prepilin-type N-terminal cleavage/methylation domain-containing protein n=1 Tax=Gilvimarinus sp. 2_MG-2023 TaxID=3062666 RepID=UPI001C096087|nr:prepilin-type N-terminal cleavage/methylation domain-containing protein [Gilvimarinus sp. 2_MG-2023]MBU2886246.1 prepilin-type N-terminal cleavage/methylation domain-containing protein [Gilvimarinus agarilyticus]MDO6570934.1 prepilin-type N-terminal cleavage/methylation domain-containing protein [Gilvimarinus sp. 2_MG-2023]